MGWAGHASQRSTPSPQGNGDARVAPPLKDVACGARQGPPVGETRVPRWRPEWTPPSPRRRRLGGARRSESGQCRPPELAVAAALRPTNAGRRHRRIRGVTPQAGGRGGQGGHHGCVPDEPAAGGRGRSLGHMTLDLELVCQGGRGDQGELLHGFNRGMARYEAHRGQPTDGDVHGRNGAWLRHPATKGAEGL